MSALEQIKAHQAAIKSLLPDAMYEIVMAREGLLTPAEGLSLMEAYDWYEDRGGNVKDWYKRNSI